MYRNLDLATLRSLIAVVDTGGMTRAANRLHLTQSAVSMQIKRLEENLSMTVFERVGRTVKPTAEGEQLLAYARRLVDLNDEAIDRLTTPRYEGSLTFGVPIDVVHPHIPPILSRFGREYPRMAIRLSTDMTLELREGLKEGFYDVILTTEIKPARGGEVLLRQPLIWTGAKHARAWRQRPLPLAFSRECIFRKMVVKILDESGIDWVDTVNSLSDDASMVASAADMGVRADLISSSVQGVVPLEHGGSLPELPEYCVVMYLGTGPNREIATLFADMLREAFCGGDNVVRVA
jgi:DNA-binding transcriptional LysR family regulator